MIHNNNIAALLLLGCLQLVMPGWHGVFFGNTPTTKTVLIFRFGTSNVVLPLCLFLCAWAPLRALCRLQRINGLASIILLWMFSAVFIPNWISQERSVEIRVSGTRGDQRYVQIFVIGNLQGTKMPTHWIAIPVPTPASSFVQITEDKRSCLNYSIMDIFHNIHPKLNFSRKKCRN